MSISDRQVRKLRKLMEHHGQLNISAAAAGMDEKTARKYLRAAKLPSEMQAEHSWQTREDPFVEVWDETRSFLETNDGLEAKTIFEHLQHTHPGRFSDGQLRTFQRKVKQWRALEGAGRREKITTRQVPWPEIGRAWAFPAVLTYDDILLTRTSGSGLRCGLRLPKAETAEQLVGAIDHHCGR